MTKLESEVFFDISKLNRLCRCDAACLTISDFPHVMSCLQIVHNAKSFEGVVLDDLVNHPANRGSNFQLSRHFWEYRLVT